MCFFKRTLFVCKFRNSGKRKSPSNRVNKLICTLTQTSEREPAGTGVNTTEAAEESTTKREEQPNSPDPELQPDTVHPQSESGETDGEPEVLNTDLS